MLFQSQLVFEGVEGALDPLPDPAQRSMPAWLISTVGAQQRRAIAGDQLLERLPGEALVAQDEQARAQPLALVLQQRGDHLALTELGVARHQATGSPSGAARTYSRKPQKKRCWLLQ